jgi:phosphoribosyl 1,2-cyclic phosphodiesterase
MAIRLAVLGSGSGGNATLIDTGSMRLLLDAGFSCRSLVQRLRFIGVEPDSIGALLLTHEHGDHVSGAAGFARSFGVPIYCTAGTARAAMLDSAECEVRRLLAGAPFFLDGVRVEPFAVPHDAVETVGYVLEARGARVGYATDLGHGPRSVRERLLGCDLLILESNHDVDLLRSGPYPESVKQRVLSRHGHLDNEEAADLLCEVAGDGTGTVVLAHLSRTNNRPDLALQAARRRFAAHGRRAPALHAAEQGRPSPWFEA